MKVVLPMYNTINVYVILIQFFVYKTLASAISSRQNTQNEVNFILLVFDPCLACLKMTNMKKRFKDVRIFKRPKMLQNFEV